MPILLTDDALDTIFRKARTHNGWLPQPVSDDLLHQLYNLYKLGPTSANTSPMRVVFVKSQAAKERLKPFLDGGNADKTMAAPVCAIVAEDMRFHEYVPKLFPQAPQFGEMFKKPDMQEFAKKHCFRNATLQGAYLILAARALGLDTGPMSGFQNEKVDAEFFPDGRWKSNFLVNLGYGDNEKLRPRNPRLEFDEACKII